jgi:hypothetical protein
MKFTIAGESHEMKIDSWQRSNVSPSIELTVERTMIETQHCPNCEATEQKLHDFRQEVSDAVTCYFAGLDLNTSLHRFVIPKPKPDPLVDVLLDMDLSSDLEEGQHDAKWLRIKLDALGFEIREKGQ